MPQPELQTILEDARTIAVVGCSADPRRTSHGIARYLQRAGYRILPINPHCTEVLGETAYPDLDSLPDDVRVDLVNIFRNPRYTDDMVAMAVRYAEATGTRPVIWTQLGVSTPAAQQRAEAAGLPYVADRCIKIEHARFVRA